MAQESAEIYDFLYVDRARVSALYAQFFPEGILTSVKTTKQSSFSDDQNIGSDVKIFKAEAKSTESGAEGIEHMFDATWSIPFEVLAGLKQRALLLHSFRDAGLGSIILTEGLMRVIDFGSMDSLWDPAIRMAGFQSANSPEATQALIDGIRAMPKAIHTNYLTKEFALWSSLLPSGLTIPTADLSLKYGGCIPGMWEYFAFRMPGPMMAWSRTRRIGRVVLFSTLSWVLNMDYAQSSEDLSTAWGSRR